jgi:hypothetical protein
MRRREAGRILTKRIFHHARPLDDPKRGSAEEVS